MFLDRENLLLNWQCLMILGEKHFQRGLCPAPRDVERSALQLASIVGADPKELGRIHAC